MQALRALSTIALSVCSLVVIPRNADAQSRADTMEYSGPDRGLLRSGVTTLVVGYAPAVVVGVVSPRAEDRYLLAPVAGPWIDFAKRDCSGCSHETLNRVLLATDGVIQDIGVLQILGSLLFTEHTVVERKTVRNAPDDGSPQLRFRQVSVRVGNGYGLSASGSF